MKIHEFGRRIELWVVRTFGLAVFIDRHERGRRFFEEVVELNQAIGLTEDDLIKIVRHVYSKPVGEVDQEFGGVGVTLLALSESLKKDFIGLTEKELVRIESMPADHFRKRHNAKAEAGVGMIIDETAA